MTSVLITGSAGFIASHLVRYLNRERPDWELVGIDRLDEAASMARLNGCRIKQICHDLKAPIRTDALVRPPLFVPDCEPTEQRAALDALAKMHAARPLRPPGR